MSIRKLVRDLVFENKEILLNILTFCKFISKFFFVSFFFVFVLFSLPATKTPAWRLGILRSLKHAIGKKNV